MINQVIEGEALRTLGTFASEIFDVVMIDPPYSSGGAFRGDRMQSTNVKYTNSDVRPETLRVDFAGDTRDQRSYAHWLALVLSEALRVTKPQGVIVCFTDWRQLPATTDAIQAGGWCWRGLCVWDKTEGARPTLGRFTSQCEYIVWGSKGDMPIDRLDGAEKRTLPGVFRVPVRQADKHHVTGKPTALMRQLVKICPPGGTILDFFAGSGSTPVAAKLEGFNYVAVEMMPHYVEICRQRLGEADETGALQGSFFPEQPAPAVP